MFGPHGKRIVTIVSQDGLFNPAVGNSLVEVNSICLLTLLVLQTRIAIEGTSKGVSCNNSSNVERIERSVQPHSAFVVLYPDLKGNIIIRDV